MRFCKAHSEKVSQAPEVIDQKNGSFRQPRLAINNAGARIAAWGYDSAAAAKLLASSNAFGAGWTPPDELQTFTTVWDISEISLGHVARGYITWRQVEEVPPMMSEHSHGSRYQATPGWSSTPEMFLPYRRTTMAINPIGDGMMIGALIGNPSRLTGYTHSWVNGFGTGTVLDETTSISSPVVSVDGQANGWVAWIREGTTDSIRTAHYDRTTGWEAAVDIPGTQNTTVNFIDLDISNTGRGILSWQGFDGVHRSMYASTYDPVSGWSGAQLIESSQCESSIEFSSAVETDGSGYVAWIEDCGPFWRVMATRYHHDSGWGGMFVVATSAQSFRDVEIFPGPDGGSTVLYVRYDGLIPTLAFTNFF